MTPEQLDDCLTTVRWSPEILAGCLGCDVSLVHAWLNGEADIPMKFSAWMNTLATVHLAFEMEKPKSLRGKRFKPA